VFVAARHPITTVQAALRLLENGRNPAQVGRALALPESTVSNWRRGRVPARALAAEAGVTFCPDCGGEAHRFEALPPGEYAYLLGSYLGDGCIFHSGRTTYLRITQDVAYPGIVEEACAAIEVIRGHRPNVARDPRGQRCVHIVSYWNPWPCLLPQHGPGRKHKRKIALEEWQWELVQAAPGQFLRGLVHTDGWRGTNRVFVKGKRYEYPRYQFSNRSDDIRRLFTDVCDLLGIAWRPWGRWHVSVARRDAVARLDEFVGLKY
jgi:hypothetical protein